MEITNRMIRKMESLNLEPEHTAMIVARALFFYVGKEIGGEAPAVLTRIADTLRCLAVDLAESTRDEKQLTSADVLARFQVIEGGKKDNISPP